MYTLVYTLQSFTTKKGFLVTQWPEPDSKLDFLGMLIDYKVHNVIMLLSPSDKVSDENLALLPWLTKINNSATNKIILS